MVGNSSYALVSLENPTCSHTRLFINAITLTNVSGNSFSAEIYLWSTPLSSPPSTLVSCVNTALPPPIPEGTIHWLPSIASVPSGISIFSRIITPTITTVIDGGQLIIGPGQSLLLYLRGYLPINHNPIIVAFGWWEEPCDPYTTW
ncbi:MAG: DUF6143 family protein [Cellulosilyticaceae bacterium]